MLFRSLMITDGQSFWFIKNGKRMKCYSKRAFDSWSLPAILVEPQFIKSIKFTGTLGFRDGSLIKDIVSGKIYLISNGKSRLVSEPDILNMVGRDRIVEVSPQEISIHPEGEVLSG